METKDLRLEEGLRGRGRGRLRERGQRGRRVRGGGKLELDGRQWEDECTVTKSARRNSLNRAKEGGECFFLTLKRDSTLSWASPCEWNGGKRYKCLD